MQEFIMQNQWIIYALIVWTFPWKGIALWKAANNKHKFWFVIIFLLNTLAMLDIVYILFFSKRKKEEKIEKQANIPMIPRNGNKIV
jgi:methionyl-tRNA synthetase